MHTDTHGCPNYIRLPITWLPGNAHFLVQTHTTVKRHSFEKSPFLEVVTYLTSMVVLDASTYLTYEKMQHMV
jgi:hypothetical protein